MPRRELKQRLSESRAKRIFALPSGSCFNRARALLACYRRDARRLNNHNTAKKNGYFLGHSDNLITLSSAVDASVVRQALDSAFTDFEDALQHFSAKTVEADCIVTRNKKDFDCSEIPVYELDEFMLALNDK